MSSSDVTSVRVKICGLTRPQDARIASEAGADLLGAVLVSGSLRAVSAERAREIGEEGGLPLVVVVADAPTEVVARWAQESRASVIQLHGSEPPHQIRALREIGDWKIWKALRVRDPAALADLASPFLELVDGLLLDGWHPDLLGGSGIRFDWSGAAASRDVIPESVDLVAAGGLDPENVRRVIQVMQPHIVDVSSGVESAPGIKDPESIRAFIQAAQTAAGDGQS